MCCVCKSECCCQKIWMHTSFTPLDSSFFHILLVIFPFFSFSSSSFRFSPFRCAYDELHLASNIRRMFCHIIIYVDWCDGVEENLIKNRHAHIHPLIIALCCQAHVQYLLNVITLQRPHSPHEYQSKSVLIEIVMPSFDIFAFYLLFDDKFATLQIQKIIFF